MQQSCKQLSLHCLLNIFSSLCLWIHHSLRPCLLCSSRLSPVHCRSCNSYITPHPFIILALGGEYWTVTYPHIDTIVEKAERLLDRRNQLSFFHLLAFFHVPHPGGGGGRQVSFTQERAGKAGFHLDLFPLHPSFSDCWMMCNFHTRKPPWITRRRFRGSARCV